MDFKTRRIRKEPRPPKRNRIKFKGPSELKKPKNEYTVHLAAVGGSIGLIVLLLFGIYWTVSSLDFSKIVFSFGKPLQTDENGKTNILLIGTGGENHDGANLTDTIIVASIDYDHEVVPMLSIPRDFYIMPRQQRINSVYDTELQLNGPQKGVEKLEEIVQEVTGIDIQYYAKVDFNGFVKIVDAVGGVEVNVEEPIYDPYYPKDGTIYYETFSIDEGYQTLDGETALKYARSRKTTSDFDRAKRQQQILFAMKEKALSLNILTNAGKIGDIYDSVDDSIETNLTLPEIIELGKLAKDFKQDSILPLVINDDPTDCGGLVYTPAREYFDGASVLLPVGEEYDYVKFFIGTTFNNIETITHAPDEIQVLNGTHVPGLAYEGLNLLSRFCLNTVYYGNAQSRDLEQSTVYYSTDEEGNPPKTLPLVETLMPGVQTAEGIPPDYLATERRQNSNIVVELGSDYLSKRIDDPFKNLRFFAPPPKPETEQEEDQAEASAAEETTEPTAADEAAATNDTPS